MEVKGNEGGAISKQTAEAWINNFRSKAQPKEVTAHLFGREIIEQVLAQPGCVGIRIYYALDNNGAKQLIIYGVDKDGNGIENVIADQSIPCPPFCGRP